MSAATHHDRMTISDVTTQLVAEDYINEEDKEKIIAALSEEQQSDGPWFVQFLSVVGSWIAVILLLVSCGTCSGLMNFTENGFKVYSLLMGSGLCAGAFWLRTSPKRDHSTFVSVLALAIGIVGQVLLIVDAAAILESVNGALVIALILQAIFLRFFPGRVMRFLAWLSVVGILLYFVVDARFYVGIYGLAVLLAAYVTYLWYRHPALVGDYRTRDIHRTSGYALPIAMFVLLLIPLMNIDLEDYTQSADYHKPLIAASGLFLVVVALEIAQVTRLDIPSLSRESGLLAICTVLVFVSALWTPGIPAAMLVLLLGYWRSNRVLMGIATAFLCVFVAQFYYFLDVTLLVKSAMMTGTGIVLLGMRYVLFNYVQL